MTDEEHNALIDEVLELISDLAVNRDDVNDHSVCVLEDEIRKLKKPVKRWYVRVDCASLEQAQAIGADVSRSKYPGVLIRTASEDVDE